MRWQFSIRTFLVVITVFIILVVTIVRTQIGVHALVKMGLIPELRITNATVQFQGETYYILDECLDGELPEGFQFVTTLGRGYYPADAAHSSGGSIEHSIGMWVIQFDRSKKPIAILDLGTSFEDKATLKDVTGDKVDELILTNRLEGELPAQWEWGQLLNDLDYVSAYGAQCAVEIRVLNEFDPDDYVRVIGFEKQGPRELFAYSSDLESLAVHGSGPRGGGAVTTLREYRWADLFDDGTPVCCLVETISSRGTLDGKTIPETKTKRLAGYFDRNTGTGVWAVKPCQIEFENELDGLLAEENPDR